MTNAYIFSHNRIAPELSLSARSRHYEHYPLVKGNVVPEFFLKRTNRLYKKSLHTLSPAQDIISLDELLINGTPLIIAFYSPVVHKAQHLQFFKNLQDSIGTKAKMIILADPENAAIRQTGDLLAKLNIYIDRHNVVSEAFGLYNDQNPLWNWVPGVESDTAFINALYVVAPNKQIVFHHIDYSFSFFNQPQQQQENFIEEVVQKVETTTFPKLAYATS